MRWYFLRHADKEAGDFYNPHLRHQDRPLSEKGWQAARALTGYFSGQAVTQIYVSGYQRTRQTIQPLADILQMVPVLDERLNEIDNGLVDEMTATQFQQAYPLEWETFRSRQADFRFPGGETGLEAQSRIVDFVDEKTRQQPGGNILVASHDGLIRLWVCHVLGVPVFRRMDLQVDLCGLTELDYLEDEQRWKLVRFNQAIR